MVMILNPCCDFIYWPLFSVLERKSGINIFNDYILNFNFFVVKKRMHFLTDLKEEGGTLSDAIFPCAILRDYNERCEPIVIILYAGMGVPTSIVSYS